MSDSVGQPQPEYLLVGEILRPHGVQGELRVRLLTEYPERIPQVPSLFLGAGVDARSTLEVHVVSMRMHQGFALIKFREYADRTQAERLRGQYIMVRLADAVPLDEGEFYLYQVIGLAVRTEDGQDLGTVAEVLETGANDVYIVHGDRYGEVLIPVTTDTIIQTDIPGRLLTVRLPAGLLPGPDQTSDEE